MVQLVPQALMHMVGEDCVFLLRMSYMYVTLFARRLCISYVDPKALALLLACCLIVLNTNPGVHPIGIGDVARHIIAKAILFILKSDIQDAVGSMQLCAGQIAEVEAAIHAMRELFEKDETEALLLVNASNAFHALTTLLIIRRLSPLSAVLVNTHHASTKLYADGTTLLFPRRNYTRGPTSHADVCHSIDLCCE